MHVRCVCGVGHTAHARLCAVGAHSGAVGVSVEMARYAYSTVYRADLYILYPRFIFLLFLWYY
jgi:hypothetical protein